MDIKTDLRYRVSNMSHLDTLFYGNVRVRFFCAQKSVRWVCYLPGGGQRTFMYSTVRTSDLWVREDILGRHTDTVRQVVAFLRAHTAQEGAA